MDVRFCEGRNHRREARVRAAGSARVRRCALLRSALQENLFLLDKDLHGGRQPFLYWITEGLLVTRDPCAFAVRKRTSAANRSHPAPRRPELQRYFKDELRTLR